MGYDLYVETTKQEQEKLLNLFDKLKEENEELMQYVGFGDENKTYLSEEDKGKTVFAISYGSYAIAHTIMYMVCKHLNKKEYNYDGCEMLPAQEINHLGNDTFFKSEHGIIEDIIKLVQTKLN